MAPWMVTVFDIKLDRFLYLCPVHLEFGYYCAACAGLDRDVAEQVVTALYKTIVPGQAYFSFPLPITSEMIMQEFEDA